MEIKHMELKKYALSDVCTIVPGFAFKSKDFGSGENIAVKIKDIEPPSVNIKNAERVCFTPQDKFRLSEGDYIMAMTGATIGKVGKLQIDAKNVYINQRVCKFNPFTSVCDKEYLYYVLSTSSFRNFIYNNVDSKLAQPNIGHTTIYKYTHLFPSNIKEQKLIASVLNNIDRKIELNKQINDNLEAMARQLYDYWFVQFDFPNENGKPYKSNGGKMVWNEKLKRNIPNKWNNGILSNIANITMGQSPDGSSYNENGNGTIFYQGSTDFGIRFPSIRKYTTAPSRFAKKGDILMSVRAPVGAMNIANNDCCIGRGLTSLSSKVGSTTHLYYILDDLRMKFENINSAGTTFGALTKDGLYGLPVVVPSVDIIKQFEDICKPIFDKQMCIGEEINALTKQRDELLPLLMNGQATVNYHLSLAHITPTTLAPLCTP